MLTHEEARSLFGRCRNQSIGHKLDGKTYIQMRGSSFAVRLHNTDIVVIRPDNTYKLNSGGFRKITTKRRMNDVLPCVINQKDGLWSIGNSFFQDGMLIRHDGAIVGESIPLSDALEIKRKVDRYCNKFISLVLDMCVLEPIGELQKFKRYHLPNHNNDRHLDDLWWCEILPVVNATRGWKKGERGLVWCYNRLMKWAYLSMLERGHSDIEWCWDYRRNACERKNCHAVRNDLLAFMLKRKANITQMILDHNKSENETTVRPSASETEGILSQELSLAS